MANKPALLAVRALKERRDLTASSKCVAEALAVFAGEFGCHPRTQKIAQKIGMTTRTVFNSLKRLEALGLIERTARYIPGTKIHRANEYNLTFAAMPVSERTEPISQQSSGTLSKLKQDSDTQAAFQQPAVAANVQCASETKPETKLPEPPHADSPLPEAGVRIKSLLGQALKRKVSDRSVRDILALCHGVEAAEVFLKLSAMVMKGYHAASRGKRQVHSVKYYVHAIENWLVELRESHPLKYYPKGEWTPPPCEVAYGMEVAAI